MVSLCFDTLLVVWWLQVIANYGGSKQVDNDDGSLFYKVHSNFMA